MITALIIYTYNKLYFYNDETVIDELVLYHKLYSSLSYEIMFFLFENK